MGFPWAKLLSEVELVAPLLLGGVNPVLLPVASVIIHGINQAQSMPGKTGAEKFAIVQNMVENAASVIPGVDPAAINDSLQEGIDTVLAVQKIRLAKGNLAAAAGIVPAPPAVPPAA